MRLGTQAITIGQLLSKRRKDFMSGKTYAILGGGGSFGIHTALYLLEHANPKKVIGIGRNPLRSEPFSLNIEKYPLYE
jgi:dTDP-glucose 4,6-dehydratase